MIQTLGTSLRDLILPPHCALCGRRTGGAPVCDDCAQSLTLDMNPRSIDSDTFPFFIPAFKFEDNTRELIHLLKYASRPDIGHFFGASISEKLDRDLLEGVDAWLPVPLHHVKERSRGFNQSRMVAERLASDLGIPIAKGAVRRIRNTNTQTKLDAKERKINVSGAFRATRDLKGQSFVIVDDVITTGATTSELARAVLDAGGEVRFALAISAPALSDSKEHEI